MNANTHTSERNVPRVTAGRSEREQSTMTEYIRAEQFQRRLHRLAQFNAGAGEGPIPPNTAMWLHRLDHVPQASPPVWEAIPPPFGRI
jgi:hypothetical protein